jgi:hypothetical protein
MSACVTVYVPVQVVEARGTRVVTGQVITGCVFVPENAVSDADTPVSVTLPVLVTKNEYATDCPAPLTTVGVADLVSESAGAAATVTVAVDGADVTAGPVGGVPDDVAVLVTVPASMSACVTVYVPVQVVESRGARVVTGQLITGGVPVPENAVSVADTPVRVALPVLVSRNEYVTV